MARPHKGDRERVVTRPPAVVYAALLARVEDAGVSSVSQYLADLLALHTGHPELVCELNQEVIALGA